MLFLLPTSFLFCFYADLIKTFLLTYKFFNPKKVSKPQLIQWLSITDFNWALTDMTENIFFVFTANNMQFKDYHNTSEKNNCHCAQVILQCFPPLLNDYCNWCRWCRGWGLLKFNLSTGQFLCINRWNHNVCEVIASFIFFFLCNESRNIYGTLLIVTRMSAIIEINREEKYLQIIYSSDSKLATWRLNDGYKISSTYELSKSWYFSTLFTEISQSSITLI